jgi:hypothetical protein
MHLDQGCFLIYGGPDEAGRRNSLQLALQVVAYGLIECNPWDVCVHCSFGSSFTEIRPGYIQFAVYTPYLALYTTNIWPAKLLYIHSAVYTQIQLVHPVHRIAYT